MPRPPSPCLGICKFRRPGPAGEHCIACSMTKQQKKVAKGIGKPGAMSAFLVLVVAQQRMMGRYGHWPAGYAARCAEKGAAVPKAVRHLVG